MSTYTPDKWVLLRIKGPDSTIEKVLAGWSGSYLHGQSWKLNSGNEKTEEFDDRFEFTGYTGSVYICRKGSYGTNMISQGILDQIVEKFKGIPDYTLEVVNEEDI